MLGHGSTCACGQKATLDDARIYQRIQVGHPTFELDSLSDPEPAAHFDPACKGSDQVAHHGVLFNWIGYQAHPYTYGRDDSGLGEARSVNPELSRWNGLEAERFFTEAHIFERAVTCQ